ncbi:hypothetical protein VTK26DRAFT_3845 [Humicola hyalothermophila]
MDPFCSPPPADTLAAARLHVQALTDCGLPREALLCALLENYGDGGVETGVETGFQQPTSAKQQGPQDAACKMSHNSYNTRLSVSTTSTESSGRSSVLSTATTMSSVSSYGGAGDGKRGQFETVAAPPLPPPPTNGITAPPPPPKKPAASKSSNRGSSKPQGAYWCTFCDVAFQRKFDWKRHEDEFHERYKCYPCPNCSRIFWGANTFNQHHKNAHGCRTCPHADKVVRYTQRKQAWACGFCGGYLASRDRYFDHVARHYEDGCNKSHWNHSLVIYGLLHQPAISQAWKELDAALYGHLPRNQQPMLEWDPNTTGHVQGFFEGDSPGGLQDLLEFFQEGRDDPRFLAHLAHDSAKIRLRSEVQPAAAPAPNPSASSPSSQSRPVSEPPKQTPKPRPAAKHMSVPEPPLPPTPVSCGASNTSMGRLDPGKNNPFMRRQQDIAPAPPRPPEAPQKPLPMFDYGQPAQHPHQTPIVHGVMSSFPQQQVTMGGTAQSGGYYDLAVTHVLPHTMQQQQHQHVYQHPHHRQHQHEQQEHVIAPMNVYEDWSSLAGTVVDESVFTSVMAMGWQANDSMGGDEGHQHPG